MEKFSNCDNPNCNNCNVYESQQQNFTNSDFDDGGFNN